MNIKRWEGKVKWGVVKEEFTMGVSMAILKPLEGKVARDFVRESEKAKISAETIKKCFELVRDIKIK